MEKGLSLFFIVTLLAFASAGADAQARYDKAIFAGGCFWCMTPPYEGLKGVTSVVAGYAGGTGENPTYEDYTEKGYVEAVEVTYDPAQVTYPQLLDVFWRQINPTDPGGQFCDRGPQYRSVIYYESEAQKQDAEKSKAELAKSRRYDKPLVTEITAASTFYKAEDYHQDYYKKHPIKYRYYRFNCGRDKYLKKIWGKEAAMNDDPPQAQNWAEFKKPGKEELKKILTPLQYEVTQEGGTETPFHNEYWNNKREGIYVDIVSGEPLYSSLDEFDSGTGWPSFTRPMAPENLKEVKHWRPFHPLIEIRSVHADSHLGHVFDDGPPPTHLRYCMNSAALRFVPKADLEKEGYGQYLKVLEKK